MPSRVGGHDQERAVQIGKKSHFFPTAMLIPLIKVISLERLVLCTISHV